MQKTQPKVISISDLIQWSGNGELELSPKYQRNKVWNDKAKAYLIDTIIRGLPIPPVFLRQKVDVNTRTTFREVVDGQQRIRAILEFAADEFSIQKSHNKEYGGKRYSELSPEKQEEFLEYEIFAETVVERDETIIYDMFARLNSNNMVLNQQEIRNSKYWGEFKVLVYKLTSRYREFLLENKIISDADCSRMHDAELFTSMILVISEGIIGETPTVVNKFYQLYDARFPRAEEIENKLECVMSVAEKLYVYFNGNAGCFSNKNYFFSLYCVLLNQMYGISGENLLRNELFSIENINTNLSQLKRRFSQFILDYTENIEDTENINGKYAEYMEFSKNHSVRTTSKSERRNRIDFLNTAIGRDNDDD